MMKNSATIDNVSLFLADLEQDESINLKFNVDWKKTFLKEEDDEKQGEMFEEMVDMVVNKYKNSSEKEGRGTGISLPKSLKELYTNFNLVYPSTTIKEGQYFEEPTSAEEVQKSVISRVSRAPLVGFCRTQVQKQMW